MSSLEAKEGGQERSVAYHSCLTIASTRTANYATLCWQPVMRHVRQQGSGWRRDVADMYLSLADALRVTGRTPEPGRHLEFALQQWTSLVTPNAFTDLNQAVNFSVAVDAFQVDWQQGAPR